MKAVIIALLVTLLTVSAFVPSSFSRFGSRSQLNMGNCLPLFCVLHVPVVVSLVLVSFLDILSAFVISVSACSNHFL